MKIGDRVVINTDNTTFMRQWREGADSTVGIIILDYGFEDTNDAWFKVKFPNGYENIYGQVHLKLVGPRPLDTSEYEEIMAAQVLMEAK
jgi:hypothetical protein